MNELIPLESTFSAGRRWQPPLSPDHYDCSPLTAVEWKAVQCCAATDKSQTITPRYREALSGLGRIHQPFEDAYLLGHSAAENSFASGASVVRRTLAKAVCQTRKLFWDWSQAEWLAVLGPSGPQFAQAWGWNAYSARLSPNLLGGRIPVRLGQRSASGGYHRLWRRPGGDHFRRGGHYGTA